MFVPYSSRICFHSLEPLSPSSDNTTSVRRLEAKEGDTTKPGHLAWSPSSHPWSSAVTPRHPSLNELKMHLDASPT